MNEHTVAITRLFDAAAMLEGMPKTWAQTVDRLDAHLAPNP